MQFRITSYNVCYTKLLRVAQALSQLLRPHLAEIVTHAARIKNGVAGVCTSLDCPEGKA